MIIIVKKVRGKMNRFKVGDKVRFVKKYFLRVPEYFYERDLEISELRGNELYGIKEHDLEFPLDVVAFRGDSLEPAKAFESKLKESLEITNEQKIKELEDQIKAKQAEIEKLKKPKHDLYMPAVGCDYFIPVHDSAWKTTCFMSPTLNGAYFADKEQADYYARKRYIFDTLANFAAHNDPTEKDQEWNGVVAHWCVLKMEGKWNIAYDMDNYNPTTVYFSTKELAGAALEMLKRENLI